MTNITFPLSEANVAQCMAERDAEIERLRQEKQGLHGVMERMAKDSNNLAREIERLKRKLLERVNEIELLRSDNIRLRAALTAERALRCSCQIADHISDECARLGKCKERLTTPEGRDAP